MIFELIIYWLLGGWLLGAVFILINAKSFKTLDWGDIKFFLIVLSIGGPLFSLALLIICAIGFYNERHKYDK
jgi:hypothetical protein